MTSSPDRAPLDDLPPALSSMWRLCKLGYRHEPGLMLAAFLLSLAAALPDALLALWLMLLGKGVMDENSTLVFDRRDRPRCLGRRNVVSAHSEHARAKTFSRPGHHRARVPRRAVTGVGADDCAPGATRIPRSPRDVARSGVRAGSHVHVGVLDVGVDPAARDHDRVAHVDTLGPGATRGLRATHRDYVDLAPGRRARGSGARRDVESSRTSSVHDGNDGARPARKSGSPASGLDSSASAALRGNAATDRLQRRAHAPRPGTCLRGPSSRARTSARSCSSHRSCMDRPQACCSCLPRARGCPRTSVPRSVKSASSLAFGCTAHGGSRGSRTTRPH